MDDYSALNQIKLLTQSSIIGSQLDIELLVLHLLEIDRNTLYRFLISLLNFSLTLILFLSLYLTHSGK